MYSALSHRPRAELSRAYRFTRLHLPFQRGLAHACIDYPVRRRVVVRGRLLEDQRHRRQPDAARGSDGAGDDAARGPTDPKRHDDSAAG